MKDGAGAENMEAAKRETWLMVAMIVIVGLSAAIISVQLGLPA